MSRAAVSIVILALVPCLLGKPQGSPTQTATRIKDRNTIEAFTARAASYVKLRNRIEKKLPKISKDSTPEQISANKKASEDAMRVARTGARPGEIFNSATAEYIRRLVRTEFKGTERREVRETILEAETAGIPLRVDYPYPETREVATLPPALLLKLPSLPKELKYRFVGRHLLLVDRDNGLILDYMLNALP